MHQLKAKKINNDMKDDEKKRFALWTYLFFIYLFIYLFIYFLHHTHIDVRGLDKLRRRCRSGAYLLVRNI